ncbi:MAG: hypothetical protein ACE5JL_11795 [Dehalococcoidia bacterium]
MSRGRKIIGFDRKIRLSWLDATADWAAQGRSAAEIRARLDQLLDGQVAGEGSRSARGKTKTVLLHIWVLVPEHFLPLRDDGLALLRQRSGRDRLPLHWAMCVATYPFFRELAATTGRLLGVQGTATLSQIARRMTEAWGERSTVIRAVQRLTRCFVDWGALRETGERGVFNAPQRVIVAEHKDLGLWMLEAALSNCDAPMVPLRSLIGSSAFFPFSLSLSPRDVGGELQAGALPPAFLNEDMVMLRESR